MCLLPGAEDDVSSSEPHGMSVEPVSPREYWDAVRGRWKKECWTGKKSTNQQLSTPFGLAAQIKFSEKLFSEGCRWEVSWHTFSELGKKRNQEGEEMCKQLLASIELSISAVLTQRYCSNSARDPGVGDGIRVNTDIFSQIICTFSPKYSLLVMPCRVRGCVHSFVHKDTHCRL